MSASAAQRPPYPTLSINLPPYGLNYPRVLSLQFPGRGSGSIPANIPHARAVLGCRHPTQAGLCSPADTPHDQGFAHPDTSWAHQHSPVFGVLHRCVSESPLHLLSLSSLNITTKLGCILSHLAPSLPPDLWFPGNPGCGLSISTRHIGL